MAHNGSEQRYREARKNHDRIARAVAVVEYIVETHQEENPDSGWENLPWLIQYYPLILKYLRHIRKVPALNPGMDGIGGLIGASKLKIFSCLASSSYAKTLFVPAGTTKEHLGKLMDENFPEFPDNPVICKPNMGERSINVTKARNYNELNTYNEDADFDYLIQEYIPGPEEFGVSCFRNMETGLLEIAAIVSRKVAKSVGDGTSTIRDLIMQSSLTSLHKERIMQCYSDDQAAAVPESGAIVMLSPVASLAYGTVIEEILREDHPEGFKNLEDEINRICINDDGVPFDGFNYGRFDYRAPDIHSLFDGKGSILELNGAAAMALHACVPGLTIEKRYEIFQEFFDRMIHICRINRKAGKGRYMFLLTLYRQSRHRLHSTTVQWDAVRSSLKELKQARKALKRLM